MAASQFHGFSVAAHAIHFKSGISETSAAGRERWKLAAAPVIQIASGHDVVIGNAVYKSQRVFDSAQLPAATRVIYVGFFGGCGIMAQPRARYEQVHFSHRSNK